MSRKRVLTADGYNPGQFIEVQSGGRRSSPKKEFSPVYNEISEEIFHVLRASSSTNSQPSNSYMVWIAGPVRNGARHNVILKERFGKVHMVNGIQVQPESEEWTTPSYNWNSPINTSPQSLMELVTLILFCLTSSDITILENRQNALDLEHQLCVINQLEVICEGRQRLDFQLIYLNRRALKESVEDIADEIEEVTRALEKHRGRISELTISKQQIQGDLDKSWSEIHEKTLAVQSLKQQVVSSQGKVSDAADKFVALFPDDTFESPTEVEDKLKAEIRANMDRNQQLLGIVGEAILAQNDAETSLQLSSSQAKSAEEDHEGESNLYKIFTNDPGLTDKMKEQLGYRFAKFINFIKKPSFQSDIRLLVNGYPQMRFTEKY